MASSSSSNTTPPRTPSTESGIAMPKVPPGFAPLPPAAVVPMAVDPADPEDGEDEALPEEFPGEEIDDVWPVAPPPSPLELPDWFQDTMSWGFFVSDIASSAGWFTNDTDLDTHFGDPLPSSPGSSDDESYFIEESDDEMKEDDEPGDSDSEENIPTDEDMWGDDEDEDADSEKEYLSGDEADDDVASASDSDDDA